MCNYLETCIREIKFGTEKKLFIYMSLTPISKKVDFIRNPGENSEL